MLGIRQGLGVVINPVMESPFLLLFLVKFGAKK